MNVFARDKAQPQIDNSKTIRLPVMRSLGLVALLTAGTALAGSFLGSNSPSLGTDFVLHAPGYDGSGGVNTVTVCVDPDSAFASEMETSIRNNIMIWNALLGTTENLSFFGDTNIPTGKIDFESVSLHEMGHCLGLGHTNIGGSNSPESNYTESLPGADNTFDLDSGSDGIIGSGDDLRDDDINLVWYAIADNDPCSLPGSTVDSTTYAVDTGMLVGGDTYAANADRDVCAALGHTNTEASMNQLTFSDEAQRELGHDDVATIRYAQSGIDEIQATGDDYTVEIVYGGMTTTGCDIIAKFDNTQTTLAVCSAGFSFPAFPDLSHGTIFLGEMFFNTEPDWFFNDQLLGVPQNTAPQLAAIAAQFVTEGDSLQIALSATDDDEGDTLTLSSTTLPGFCLLTDNGDGSGSIDCMPLPGDADVYPVSVEVSDDGSPSLNDQQDFDLTVTPAPLDTDNDGITDDADNCLLVANPDQRDTDGDNIGNRCDPDLDQSCFVNFNDLSAMSDVFFTNDADADFDGSGLVNFLDLQIMSEFFFTSPGPSGLANACSP